MPGRLLAPGWADLGSPAELPEERRVAALDRVRDQGAEDGRELERVAAVAGGDGEPFAARTARDAEVTVPGVAGETDACPRVLGRRERRGGTRAEPAEPARPGVRGGAFGV